MPLVEITNADNHTDNATLVNPAEWFGLVKVPNIYAHLKVGLHAKY
jgi:hypothetical protein